MPACRRVTIEQLEELVAWMESHPLQARGTTVNGSQAKLSSDRLWEELTFRLNAVDDGVTKTAKEWRQYWSDQKCKVKKKRSAMRQHGSGGSSWDGILTPIEDRILSIMGVQNVMGIEDVHVEVQLEYDSPSLPLLELPLSRPVTPDPTPSSSGQPTADVATRVNATPPNTQPSPSQADADEPPERSRPHKGAPPRWALDLETRRIREGKKRRELEEQRVAIEKRRLAMDERRLALDECRLDEYRTWRRDRVAMEERRLAMEERRLAMEKRRMALVEGQMEEDRTWRRDLLSALQRGFDLLGQPPRLPSSFK